MPTVPRYGGPQVTTDPKRIPYESPDIPRDAIMPTGPADAIAAGAQAVAPHLEREYARQVGRANDMAVTSATAKLADLETRVLHDPKEGVLNIRGKDSLNSQKLADDAWVKGVSEIEAELTNDTQRMAFKASALNRQSAIRGAVTQHTSRELQKFDAQETEALEVNERNAAVATAAVEGASFMDVADRASMAIGRQRDAIRAFAERQGVAPERREQMLEEAASRTHAAIITQLSAKGDDQTAQAYYAEYKEQLRGEEAAQMAKLVQDGSVRGQSQREADRIYTVHKNDREKAYEAAKKIENAEVRDMTTDRLRAEYARADAAERDAQEERYLTATNLIEPFVASGKPFVAHEVIPNNIWSKLTLEQRNALERRADQGDRKTNDKLWLDFLDLGVPAIAKLTRSEFETKYWSNFSNQDRGRAESYWKGAQEAERSGKLSAKMSSDVTFQQQIDRTLREAGFVDPKKARNELPEFQLQFYAQFEREAVKLKELYETQTGKIMTSTEIYELVDELIKHRVFVDRPFGKDQPKLPNTLTLDERGRVYVPWDDIPVAARNRLNAVIKSKGKQSSRPLIEKLYAAQITRNGDLFRRLLEEF